MLSILKLKNIALIEKQEICFEKGLNVLTGETGAGKSIIIDSISFLLGAKADKSLIRKGESIAKVEGYFTNIDNPDTSKFFSNIGVEFDSTVLISRSMTLDGKTESRINGEIVTANMLKELTASLMDIYGQNEQINILNKKYQLALIDNYNKNEIEPLMERYTLAYDNIKSINKKLEELGGDENNRATQLDICSYQINEIEAAKLKPNEQDELMNERRLLINSEKISNALKSCSDSLTDENALGSVSFAIKQLNMVEDFDEEISQLSQRLTSLKLELSDIYETVNTYLQNIEFDDNKLNSIEERISLIKKLYSKYGNNYDDVVNFLQKTKQRFELLSNAQENYEAMMAQKLVYIKEIAEIARKISSIRKNTGKLLCDQIMIALSELNMKNVKLCFDFEDIVDYDNIEKSLTQSGVDSVNLMFSANVGQPMMPLNKIISGGEMSRFMLALKSIIAKFDIDNKTMIFDEIDSGISGETAQVVANKMANISRNNQLIVVSHLFNITAMADNHYYIQKLTDGNKTFSTISKLDNDGSVMALAKMLQGNSNMAIALNHAKELKLNADKYKSNILQ